MSASITSDELYKVLPDNFHPDLKALRVFNFQELKEQILQARRDLSKITGVEIDEVKIKLEMSRMNKAILELHLFTLQNNLKELVYMKKAELKESIKLEVIPEVKPEETNAGEQIISSGLRNEDIKPVVAQRGRPKSKS